MGTKEKIIVRMPNWIGDAVMATPLLEDIKTTYPTKELVVLCHDPICTLLENNPYIDRYISFSRKKACKRAEEKRIIHVLQEEQFPLGILTTNSFSSGWCFFRGAVQKRIGFSMHLRRLLLNAKVLFPKKEEHLVTTYKRLLEPLNIGISTTKPSLYVTPSEKASAREFLTRLDIKEDTPLIGINPGAAYGPAKCWPEEHFHKTALQILQNKKTHILFFGDPSSQELIDRICRYLPEKRAHNLAGKTSLRELLSLITCCSLFLTNDSGPMHIAAALGIPVIALFGSTNPRKTGPYGVSDVIYKEVPCSPCYFRECPIDFRCMKTITPQEVVDKVHGKCSL